MNESDNFWDVVDYFALNKVTKRNSAIILRSDKMFDWIGAAKVFSTIEYKTGFHQNRMEPKDVKKPDCNTKYCKFEYLVVPLWACNEPSTFWLLMNQIFHEYENEVVMVYIGSFLIFSKALESHYKHLKIVCSPLMTMNRMHLRRNMNYWRKRLIFVAS